VVPLFCRELLLKSTVVGVRVLEPSLPPLSSWLFPGPAMRASVHGVWCWIG